MYSFIWKGQNSLDDYGLWIRKLPVRVRPSERHKVVKVPGKPGSMILTEGDDVFDSYAAEMVVTCPNTIPIDRVMAWLRGSSELVLSNDIDKCRPARIVGQVRFDRDGNSILVGTIPFLFQPFRQSRFPEQTDRKTITGTSATITNLGDVASRPKVTITGSGNNTITIGGMAMTFTGISGTIVVDCDAEMITSNGALWTGTSTGDFWRIPTGQSTITQTGSMTIVVDPCWRWL